MNGAELIAAERERQVKQEGWTAEHDDTHSDGEMAFAAVCYVEQSQLMEEVGTYIPSAWPWQDPWWKPSPDRKRNLVKAGALIAAEIDRLQRLAASGSLSGKQK